MRMDVEVNGRSISAVSAEELGKVPTPEVVLDLRKSTEIPAGEAAPPKVVRLPVTAGSLSEQDMDQARREFARGAGPFVVLSETGRRAAAVVLAHAGRVLGWKTEQALERCPDLSKSPDLARFLETYLAEHADRSERKDGNF